jgi:hypothetical protein
MSHASTAASVRLNRELHPELYCPVRNCLWRLSGGSCPKLGHAKALAKIEASLDRAEKYLTEALHGMGIEVIEVTTQKASRWPGYWTARRISRKIAAMNRTRWRISD